MRYHEIASGLQVPVSAEEQDLIGKAGTGIGADALDERQAELAEQLVSRGLLNRLRQDGKPTTYRTSSVGDIWRSSS